MRVLLVAVLASCSANDDFPAPRISAIMPNHGPPGTSATITGNYFCHQPASEDPLLCDNIGSVQFGAVIATATQYTDTMITVEVPNGAGAVDVTITVAGSLSNSVRFTIE